MESGVPPVMGWVTSRKFKKFLKSNFKVSNIEKKEVKKSPSPPFITSTLQQEAARKLGFSARCFILSAMTSGIPIPQKESGRLMKEDLE